MKTSQSGEFMDCEIFCYIQQSAFDIVVVIVAFLFTSHSTAKGILRQDLGLKSHPKD